MGNHISGWELTVEICNVIIFIYQQPPTKVICLPEGKLFRVMFHPFSFQIDSSQFEMRMGKTSPEKIVFR